MVPGPRDSTKRSRVDEHLMGAVRLMYCVSRDKLAISPKID
jgi:hypothetical protein